MAISLGGYYAPRCAAMDARFAACVAWGAIWDYHATWKKRVEAGSALYTDELLSYEGLAGEYAHKVINHAVAYVDGAVHTNTLENFWSLLKRAIKGTYVSIEPFHLFRYVDEQAFRFNNRKDVSGRKLEPVDRFNLALSQVAGKRLTFAEVTGKVGETAF